VTFYDPSNESALRSANSARDAGRRLKVEIGERHAASVKDLRLGLAALKAQDAEAYFSYGRATSLNRLREEARLGGTDRHQRRSAGAGGRYSGPISPLARAIKYR
jgi:hypothetical protein